MSNPKLAAIRSLEAALVVAAEAGLFDSELPAEIHPDTINAFCDGVENVRKLMEKNEI